MRSIITLFQYLVLFTAINLTNSLMDSGTAATAAEIEPGAVKISKNTDSNIDPKTLSILREMTQFIGIRNNYTFKAEMMYDNILETGRRLQVTASEKVFLEKPDKVFIEYRGDYNAFKLLYNYNKVTILDTTTNTYTEVNSPETINATFDRLSKVYGFRPPLSDFYYLFPYKSMIENVKSSYYIGTSFVFGVRCHHLSFVEEDKDWQIWIEDGNRKIPRKVVITYKNIPGSPQFIAIISDWILNEPFPEVLFSQDLARNATQSEKNLFYNKSAKNFGIIRED